MSALRGWRGVFARLTDGQRLDVRSGERCSDAFGDAKGNFEVAIALALLLLVLIFLVNWVLTSIQQRRA